MPFLGFQPLRVFFEVTDNNVLLLCRGTSLREVLWGTSHLEHYFSPFSFSMFPSLRTARTASKMRSLFQGGTDCMKVPRYLYQVNYRLVAMISDGFPGQ